MPWVGAHVRAADCWAFSFCVGVMRSDGGSSAAPSCAFGWVAPGTSPDATFATAEGSGIERPVTARKGMGRATIARNPARTGSFIRPFGSWRERPLRR